jgi:DNA-directed RNA polymerase subunit RPC12/RpoP
MSIESEISMPIRQLAASHPYTQGLLTLARQSDWTYTRLLEECTQALGRQVESLTAAEWRRAMMAAPAARPKPPHDEIDEYFCPNCSKDTQQKFTDGGHERDSSGDRFECLTCGWAKFGHGKYEPPIQFQDSKGSE